MGRNYKIKHSRCHSCEGRNPEKNSHPEFISGSVELDAANLFSMTSCF
ncbi:hypothetical protein [Rickettsia endosymbiont of Orchestes rusci]